MGKELNLKLKVWRQDNTDDSGRFEEYDAKGIDTDMSFLEMLDVVNEGLNGVEKSQSHLILTVARVSAVHAPW